MADNMDFSKGSADLEKIDNSLQNIATTIDNVGQAMDEGFDKLSELSLTLENVFKTLEDIQNVVSNAVQGLETFSKALTNTEGVFTSMYNLAEKAKDVTEAINITEQEITEQKQNQENLLNLKGYMKKLDFAEDEIGINEENVALMQTIETGQKNINKKLNESVKQKERLSNLNKEIASKEDGIKNSLQESHFIKKLSVKETEKIVKTMDKVGEATKNVNKFTTSWAVAIGSVYAVFKAVEKIIKTLTEPLELFGEQQAMEASLAQVIKTTGSAANRTAQQVKDLVSELQGLTAFGDEASLKGANLLLTFTNIKNNEYDRAVQTMLDLSQMMGGVEQSAVQLGKALNAPTANLGALSRVGIQFNDIQKEAIKYYESVNDLASAQSIILDELNRQFGGQAAEYAKTYKGEVAQVKNLWGDALEVIGELAYEHLNISDRLTTIADKIEKFIDFLKNGSDEVTIIKEMFDKIAENPVFILAKGLSSSFLQLGKGLVILSGEIVIFLTKDVPELLTNVFYFAEYSLNSAMEQGALWLDKLYLKAKKYLIELKQFITGQFGDTLIAKDMPKGGKSNSGASGSWEVNENNSKVSNSNERRSWIKDLEEYAKWVKNVNEKGKFKSFEEWQREETTITPTVDTEYNNEIRDLENKIADREKKYEKLKKNEQKFFNDLFKKDDTRGLNLEQFYKEMFKEEETDEVIKKVKKKVEEEIIQAGSDIEILTEKQREALFKRYVEILDDEFKREMSWLEKEHNARLEALTEEGILLQKKTDMELENLSEYSDYLDELEVYYEEHKTAVEKYADAMQKSSDLLLDLLNGLESGISSAIQQLFDREKSMKKRISDFFLSIGDSVMDSIVKSFSKNIAQSVTQAFSSSMFNGNAFSGMEGSPTVNINNMLGNALDITTNYDSKNNSINANITAKNKSNNIKKMMK